MSWANGSDDKQWEAFKAWAPIVREGVEHGQFTQGMADYLKGHYSDVQGILAAIHQDIDRIHKSEGLRLGEVKPDQAQLAPGGIDLNSANLTMMIKRDGKGVVLPLAQQDLAQLGNIEGLDPVILSIRPASETPVFSQLQAPS
jgi:hypothetical protein